MIFRPSEDIGNFYKVRKKKIKKRFVKNINHNPIKVVKTKPKKTKFVRKKISKTLRKLVFERDKYTCQHPDCGSKLDLTIDHIVPISKGGTNDVSNLQTLCFKHNNSKGCKIV
jgi:5-methylcytosine-specific restriction protein A